MTSKEILPMDQILPENLLIIPLEGKPIFPGIFTPILIASPDDIAIVEKSLTGDKMLGLLLVRDENFSGTLTIDDLYTVGTAAKIIKKINLPDGGINIFISTLKRFRVKKTISPIVPISVSVEYLDDTRNKKNDTVKALTRALISEMKQVSEDNPLFTEEMRLNMVNIDQPGKIADFLTSILNISRKNQQQILETVNVKSRIEKVLVFIKKEQELLKIQKKITSQLNEKIEKIQREHFLREELKAIRQELGDPIDPRGKDAMKFQKAVAKFNFEGEIKEQVNSELEKFGMMDPSSSEYTVVRNYLEMIISLPWNNSKPKDIDLKRARKILEEDHYGLQDVKERIIEYLAVRKLKKNNKGSIVCLVGPPGVGKTSIGKSIARSMNRPFFRFSVGGMRDEAEIKGHRRTYVGAMPGKIIQGLKITKTKDPVFMIDEIDKMGSSYQGDPSSALLEVLDPEQNINFRDHYLDLPFDLSHIVFVTTANTLDTIPQPLIDRMEIIRLAGYIEEEKVEIAKRYIIPKSMKSSGLTKKDIRYSSATLRKIFEGYAREAGMRSFEKAIDKIHRKVAKKIVDGEKKLPITIEPDSLIEYLGQPYWTDDTVKMASVPGTALGLAWTNFGGDVLIIEALETPGSKAGFHVTGQMGDVMKESASIAYSYVRSIAGKFGIKPEFFEENSIHLHIPEGATPKDGPSAGITMATALLSLLKKQKIKKAYAMTGELSLVGHVLPIGGLKEKTIAARRNHVKDIIYPAQNKRELDEIPEDVKKGIAFHPVETFSQVIDLIF